MIFNIILSLSEEFKITMLAVSSDVKSALKYFKEFKTEYFTSDPMIFITFLSFLSGFLSLFKAILILSRSKLTVFFYL